MSNNIPQKPYKPFTPFGIFVKHNFPFIEATYEARDNYDLLCKVVQHLKTVESNQKIEEENIEALYEFLNTLELQDEVNNKLDEMAEDGTLDEMIGRYITNDIIRIVTTREYLKTMTTLEAGMKVKTLGCYEIDDGGIGFYQIETAGESETYDESFKVELQNGLKATLIIENDIVNFRAIGGRSQSTTNTLYDNKTILENFVNYNENYIRKLTLFIPGGVYGFSETNIVSNKGFNIEGVYSYSQWKWNGTIFTPMTSNQSYIIKIGNNEIQSANISLKNIVFSGAIFEYKEDFKTYRIHSTGIPRKRGKNYEQRYKIRYNLLRYTLSCLL